MSPSKDDLQNGQLCFLDQEALEVHHLRNPIDGLTPHNRAIIFMLLDKLGSGGDKCWIVPIRKLDVLFDLEEWKFSKAPKHIPIFNPRVPAPSYLLLEDNAESNSKLQHKCQGQANHVLFDHQPMMLIPKLREWNYWHYIDLSDMSEIPIQILHEYYTKELGEKFCNCSYRFIQLVLNETVTNACYAVKHLELDNFLERGTTSNLRKFQVFWLDWKRAGWNQNQLLRGQIIKSGFVIVVKRCEYSDDFAYIVPITKISQLGEDIDPINSVEVEKVGLQGTNLDVEIDLTMRSDPSTTRLKPINVRCTVDFKSCARVSTRGLFSAPHSSILRSCHVSEASAPAVNAAFARYRKDYSTQLEQELKPSWSPREQRREAQRERRWLRAQEKYWEEDVEPY